ncbi:unnamed protein product [Effrenium voratum]|nr:unnamed protein product [Effrenium voratum]
MLGPCVTAQGGAASQPAPAVWVCQLGSPGVSGGFQLAGNAFPIDPMPQYIAYLKKAIKAEEELSIAASKMDLYSQKDDRWVKDEEAEVNCGKSKEDCYGFVPSAGGAAFEVLSLSLGFLGARRRGECKFGRVPHS